LNYNKAKKFLTPIYIITTLVIGITTAYISSFYYNFSIWLGIFGIGVTVMVATIIFIIQAWMSNRITKLTEEIHNMTYEYNERRKKRIRSIKLYIPAYLNNVNKKYTGLLEAINKYMNNPNYENRKKIQMINKLLD
jgi:hypothetical protein